MMAMTNGKSSKIGRREFLRTLGARATFAAAAVTPLESHADTETNDEKRAARYKPDSPDVQNYYRVNRYQTKK